VDERGAPGVRLEKMRKQKRKGARKKGRIRAEKGPAGRWGALWTRSSGEGGNKGGQKTENQRETTKKRCVGTKSLGTKPRSARVALIRKKKNPGGGAKARKRKESSQKKKNNKHKTGRIGKEKKDQSQVKYAGGGKMQWGPREAAKPC